MARSSRELASSLRRTADRIAAGARFSWGDQGRCHCGHLAQTLTGQSGAELHRELVRTAGDWRDHVLDYCPASGMPVDAILGSMLDAGLDLTDVAKLETLSDRAVLRRLGVVACDRRSAADSIAYFRAWAELIEAALPSTVEPPMPLGAVAPAAVLA